MSYWWIEYNWPRLKGSLVNIKYPYLKGQCDEACLELGLDPVPILINVLHRIGRKPIKYDNDFPRKNRAFLSENQVNYVEDIIVKRYTEKHVMSTKEVIQIIAELVQAKSLV